MSKSQQEQLKKYSGSIEHETPSKFERGKLLKYAKMKYNYNQYYLSSVVMKFCIS
jgi:hypothetical protein